MEKWKIKRKKSQSYNSEKITNISVYQVTNRISGKEIKKTEPDWIWVLSCVWLCVTPWTVVHQALLSLELPRQEC